jgi:metallophosphoesterase (TIGR03767 family)
VDRRTFLARTGALTAAGWGTAFLPGIAYARERTAAVSASPAGTTLERTLLPTDTGGWIRHVEGPGWPLVVRGELAEPRPGREDRRRALASIVHLTDIHVIDTQSPTRVEFLDRYADPNQAEVGFVSSAHRPQETLTGQVADAMIRRLREIAAGPVTGRTFDCAVSTGDATDNAQINEVEWMLDLLDGGRPVSLNSGDPDRYEGVQDDDELSFDPSYWHPHPSERDDVYKRVHGYPDVPGFLEVAMLPFTPAGLPCPWYSVYGNHDGLVQGNAPLLAAFEAISLSELKVVGLPDGISPAALERILTQQDIASLFGGAIDGMLSGDPTALQQAAGAPVRLVTPDPKRAYVQPRDWVRMHREDRGGPGPIGHGLSAEAAETGELHYAFDIAPGVRGIGLDTVNRTGFAQGSIDRDQFAWLEQQLIAVHSRFYAPDGTEVRTDNGDRLVVLFAHHGLGSLDNPLPDLERPDQPPPVQADELEALLHRFPNVVALVDGHTHVNRVFACPDPAGRGQGFWEISTAAHVDHPQHARLVELVDNGDGTLSVFATLVDHAGPASPPADPSGVLELASLSRELAVNDPQKDVASGLGEPGDRNVELILPAPFDLRTLTPDEDPGRGRPEEPGRPAEPAPQPAPPPGPQPGPQPEPQPGPAAGLPAGAGAGSLVGAAGTASAQADLAGVQPAGSTTLPATGTPAVVGVGAALLAGAIALRERGRTSGEGTGSDVPTS